MRFKKVVKLFEQGSVCVTGQRGCGKDMLTANVIARRKAAYVANLDYQCPDTEFHQLDYNALSLGGLTFKQLVQGDPPLSVYPYPEGADIYISDIGIYFPSQYCNELNKLFPSLPLFLALSRHIADCNVHLNVQNLNRAWDKFREQSDTYITANRCIVLFNGRWVIQQITIYDRAESCQARVRPCRIQKGRGKEGKTMVQIYKDNFYNQHGRVDSRILIYRNRSNYDTRFFKKLLIRDPDPVLEGVENVET